MPSRRGARSSVRRAESSAYHIHNGEHDDPHSVDEMPVPGKELKTSRLLEHGVAASAHAEDERKQAQSHEHMTRVETDERVEGRAEHVGGDRQMIVDDEVLPLH